MIKQLIEARIETDHPHPLDSPDYYNPAGSIEDNNTNAFFIFEIDTFFQGLPYNLLDIGCAGGQFVVDIYNKGLPWFAAGVEGGNIYGMTDSFEQPLEKGTGVLTEPRGRKNWSLYKDKCLFHADVSEPFSIIADHPDGGREPIMFHIVTAFEFFEHPRPEEIPGILQNINKHLHMGGVVCGTINMSPGDHHRCAKPREWWDEMFIQHGFEIPSYRPSPWTFLRSETPGLIPEADKNGNKVEGGKTYTTVYPFRTTYRTGPEFASIIGSGQSDASDQETRPHEFNYPFFIIKNRDC